jgi:hypothetical protein
MRKPFITNKHTQLSAKALATFQQADDTSIDIHSSRIILGNRVA